MGGEMGNAALDFDDRVAGRALKGEQALFRRLTQDAKTAKGPQCRLDSRFSSCPCRIELFQVHIQPEVVDDQRFLIVAREGLPVERGIRASVRLPRRHHGLAYCTPPDSSI